MEYRIAREARDRYRLDEAHYTSRAQAADTGVARRAAWRIVQEGGARPERPVNGGDLAAIALIHELLHRAIDQANVVTTSVTKGHLQALEDFERLFPSRPVYVGIEDPHDHLRARTDGAPNRLLTAEELLLVWVANRNPAFMRYDELFDEADLVRDTGYPSVVDAIRARTSREARKAGGQDLVERLLEPARHAPDSLVDQLRWIAANWADLVDDELQRLLARTIDVLDEEEAGARRAWERHVGGGDVQPAALFGFGGAQEEAESFSPDRDWMPDLVLLAKSSYVWLDQLSRTYGRAIRTLDAVPDEELDTLRARGFTGLWLIGLWQRSVASQRIKQLRGNPEAVASAYSLDDYRIADDLGGEPAWRNLRDRAWARGIRLAADMVPNHMGIDSRWVMEHPEWFIGRDEPPYPSYSWTGPNLSSDERVGIYLEDHYADGSDAAVVFRRVDRWSGAVRYLYHGNDGTAIPWNDTAQLDFLRTDVREQVIRTIVDVARRFPVIRFDAAMVLAKRHIQRLWYPLPGGAGGAIASRAESSMSQSEFDAAMPAEFWREVVDRVAAEAPDTLLLAEAFWLLEGYFVRTLGMHRVYNSAFMHMLRDEDNAGYRKVIRETVGFDARILGRYVNFMSNPDERTAIDQFGTGDKYLGVATLLATLPGLPMFGHGQVEGFGEKYGMEFRRAMLQEQPDAALVEQHERHVFPLLRERWRFAGSEGFRLLDAFHGDTLDDDVFAYANERRGARSLVVYRNRYAEGRVRIRGVSEALGLPDDATAWVILRDQRSGLEHLRGCRDIARHGLELELHAYQCHVFLDPSVVFDDAAGDWARLAWRLGLGAVPDVRAALQDQLLEPTRVAVEALFDAQVVRDMAGAALASREAAVETLVEHALEAIREPLASLAKAIGATSGRGASVAAVRDGAATRLRAIVDTVRAGRSASGAGTDAAAVARWLGSDRARWTIVTSWALGACLGDLVRASTPTATVGVFDAWAAGSAVARCAAGLEVGEPAVERVVRTVRGLLAVPVGATTELAGGDAIADGVLAGWLAVPAVAAATGWNEWQGEAYVAQEPFDLWISALGVRDAIGGVPDAPVLTTRLAGRVAGDGFRAPAPSSVTTPEAQPTAHRAPRGKRSKA
jgi:glycosidase